MHILCKWFGHKVIPGRYNKMIETGIDGIGRIHADIRHECERCGKTYTLSKVHIPSVDHRVGKIDDGHYEYTHKRKQICKPW